MMSRALPRGPREYCYTEKRAFAMDEIGRGVQVLAAVVATGASSGYAVSRKANGEGSFQVDIAGVATVAIQGRVEPSADWVTLRTVDQDDVDSTSKALADGLQLLPQMRANVTAWTSGAVSAWLSELGGERRTLETAAFGHVAETVDTAGTAQPIATSSTLARWAEITAEKGAADNAGDLYLGVTPDKDTSWQTVLHPGDSECIWMGGKVFDLADIDIDADNAGDGVSVNYWF